MYLIFDIGGTKTRIAISRNGKKFEKPVIFATPQKFTDGMAAFEKVFIKFGRPKLAAAAGGVPGSLDASKSKIFNAPHLPDWKNRPLNEVLKKILRCPVYLENDTAMVGLGEANAGAGKGKAIVVYITVSTGVNGVRIVDGRIDRNAMGFEIGHQIIDGASKSPKTLENYISGSSLEKKYGRLPSKIPGKFLKNLPHWLAYGLHNTILYWSPDVLVLGGTLIRLNVIGAQKSIKLLKNIKAVFPKQPLIKKAALGDLGGLYGALIYLRQNKH